jgi:hypothetical protein
MDTPKHVIHIPSSSSMGFHETPWDLGGDFISEVLSCKVTLVFGVGFFFSVWINHGKL